MRKHSLAPMNFPTPAQLESIPVYHRQTIPETYLDAMGHMNIRWYMALFDEAAWDFFGAFGMDKDYFHATHAGAFALKHFIHYLAEVRVGETVAIRSRIVARSAKRIHFMHFMINETTNTLAATMEVLGAHVDLTKRRSTPFPDTIATQIDAILERENALDWKAPICGVITP